MGRRKRDAMRESMVAQGGACLIAAQLDVVGRDLHVLFAQVLGENATHFAIADEAYIPLSWVGRYNGHLRHSPD